MYIYKRHQPYSHLDNRHRIDLFELYGVFSLLHINISGTPQTHHIGEIKQLLFDNISHLWIEFIRYVTKDLTKD